MQNVFVVLYEPQNDINIGSVVRVCRNFGIEDIRLVRPRVADPERVMITAPNAEEAVRSLKHYDDLDEALADAVRVFGSTARPRKAAGLVADPVQAAAETRSGERIALLFGREDHGLPNEALDRCDVQITIPTSPDYSSVNLAQAVLLVVWEVYRLQTLDYGTAAAAEPIEVRTEFDPAPREQMERMFGEAEKSLEAIEFFKSDENEHIMRAVRNVFHRARLDRREMAIWFGIFKEIRSHARRIASRGDSPK